MTIPNPTVTTITVAGDTEQVALINVFTVDPKRQTELVDALDRASQEIFTSMPGFLSANLHISLDGTRVVNYAQWASAQQYQDAMALPVMREHLTEATSIAQSWNPTLTRVHAIHHPAGSPA